MHLSDDLAQRLERFALDVILFFRRLRRNEVSRVLGRQLVRSGTAPGAHYREGRRARSLAEFRSKITTGLQELDETEYWLNLISGSEESTDEETAPLLKEVDELIRIFVSMLPISTRKRPL